MKTLYTNAKIFTSDRGSADFAVLSEDIFTIDPARIDQVKVEATYICGEKVY